MPHPATVLLLVTGMLLILPSLSMATMTGYCTGQYVEVQNTHIEGYLQPNEVFELWCELPNAVGEDNTIDITLHYDAKTLAMRVLLPRAIYGTSLVVFP